MSGIDDISDAPLPQVSASVAEQLCVVVENMVGGMAIRTSCLYMDEFRDSTSSRWLSNFLDFEQNGNEFPNGGFSEFIVPMIKMDKHDIRVFMSPPKVKMALLPTLLPRFSSFKNRAKGITYLSAIVS